MQIAMCVAEVLMQIENIDDIEDNFLSIETNKFLWEINQDSRIWIDIESCLEFSGSQVGEKC